MRFPRGFLSLLSVAAALIAAPVPAWAQDDASCRAIPDASQLEAQDRFREARALLQQCVNTQCGGDVRRRCAVALQKINQVTPSIVVRVEDPQGNDVVDVEVRLGNEVLATSLDGMAIPVDPGQHSFEFRRPGFEPVVRAVTIERGQKFRSLDVRLGAGPAAGGDGAGPGLSPGRMAAGISLLTVGVAGMTGFTLLGLNARSSEKDLEDDCGRSCSKARVSSVRARYVLTNVSLGVGVLALGGATWLLLTGSEQATEPGVDVGVLPGGGYASYRGSF